MELNRRSFSPQKLKPNWTAQRKAKASATKTLRTQQRQAAKEQRFIDILRWARP